MIIENKIKLLLEKVENGLLEREELTKLSFLALFSQESIFMLGLPGVAKSLLARRMKEVIKGATNFEYLMNRFSTPEEIFGPIKLSELNNDKFERKVEGYLPTSDIAFLDEIWKASPAIQNTLLTIINEKLYRNGSNDIKVPLKLLVAASNELPEQGAGLEALYDRFMIRYYVDPISNKENFNILVRQTDSKFEIDEDDKLTLNDLNDIYLKSNNIEIPDNVLDFIDNFKKRVHVELKDNAPYISDRRWKKVFKMLRVNAVISGREEVGIQDLGLIMHFVWETVEQQKMLQKIFDDEYTNLISLQTSFSINDITKSVKEARELVKYGYITTKEEIFEELRAPNNSRSNYYNNTNNEIKNYYKFYLHDSSNSYWIPLDKNGDLDNNNENYFYVYYTVKMAKKPTNTERWSSSDVDLSIPSYRSIKLTKQYNINKEIDKQMIKEAKKIVDLTSHKIALLQKDIEAEIIKLKKEKSLLNHTYLDDLELSHSKIKDMILEAVSDNNTLLGKIVSIL